MRVGKIIKRIVILLLLAGAAILFGRIFMLEDKGSLTELVPTESARAVYAAAGNNAFKTHKFPGELSADGYFTAHSLVWCPDSGELQLTARFNENLYTKLAIDNTAVLRWELRDEEGNVLGEATVLGTEEKYFYNYQRLSFNKIEITAQTQLYLFLCCDTAGYPTEETRGFTVHTPALEFRPYKLSKAEKTALS